MTPGKRSGEPEGDPQDDPVRLPDRRALEGVMAKFARGPVVKLADKAQDLMYEAWESEDAEEGIALARKALKVSPDCADAYVLLAEEEAETIEEALELYRQGIAAGERALGKKAFKEYAGHFWGHMETRPYMRAREGLAGCLWQLGSREEAVDHYAAMLKLNPNDNQGLRCLLLPHLIELGRDEEAERLYRKYEGDSGAVWVFSRTLLDFRRLGDSPEAREALHTACEGNPHVPPYLTGRKKMPGELPEYYSPGEDSEAVMCARETGTAWRTSPGALGWLAASAPARGAAAAASTGPGPAAQVAVAGRNDPCPCGSGKKYKKCCGG